jgi:uncharacterized membrane protein
VVTLSKDPSKGRLLGVDAARALALIGMMAVHLLPSRDPDGSISTAYLIASGRASGLFAILAGVSLALASGGVARPRGQARTGAMVAIIGRSVVLGLIGLFLGDLDSGVAVILVNYSLLFLIGSVFLGVPRRTLAWLAIIWAVLAPVASHWLRARLPKTTFDVTGFDSLSDPVGMMRELMVTGYYPVLVWVAYLLAGMAVGRSVLASRRVAGSLLAIGLAMAVGAKSASALLLGPLGGAAHVGELPVQFFGVTPTDSWWYLAVSTPHSGTLLDLVHTTGTALVVMSACLLSAAASDRLVAWIAGAGGMTLTLYTSHVLALTAGWGLDDRLSLWGWHVVAAIAFGWGWRTFIGRGPLETLAAQASVLAREAVLDP